ncbi:hypothetical protein KSW81_002511 [Nannochloris sp. 'desiccata']|nr:hypothetical protein KSW81_002511 [Chlorella desiccata (nom. nud.)]
MGLLRQFFKKKAEKLPPQRVNRPEDGVKSVEAALETLQIQDTRGQQTGRPLPNSSTGVQPWDSHAKNGGAPTISGILGENPLDAVVDFEATSLEAVDYTHEEEASPLQLNPSPEQQREIENEKTTSPGAEHQPVASNIVEGVIQVDQQELENLQDGTISDSEPATEQLEDEELATAATTTAAATRVDGTTPLPALVDDLSMSLAPLQTVLYLTEDNENMDDTISVVSDGYGSATAAPAGGGGGSCISETATADLVEELSELGRALETMEAEGPPGSPLSTAGAGSFADGVFGSGISVVAGVPQNFTPNSTSGGNTNGNGNSLSQQQQQQQQQPSSPGGSMSTTSFSIVDGPRFSSNMVKLYNDLALRLMDTKEYDQALQMLSKAEVILDNDAAWALPAGNLAAAATASSGSLGRSSNNDNSGGVSGSGGGLTSGSSPNFDRNFSGSFNLGSAQESSLDEAAFNSAAATLAGMDGVQSYVDRLAVRRNRLRAITYNNIGCLYKRRSLPERALTYLQNALALEEAAGDVHDCASTHLNICASYSALTRFREALAHAERAIILLQRQLWGPTGASFQDGMMYLGRVLAALAATVAAGSGNNGGFTSGGGDMSHSNAAATAAAAAAVAATYAEAHKRQRKLLASANILAMAYHNAAVEHERLNRSREAQVSYSRACSIGTKFLGPKSSTTVALLHAQKGFISRQQREAGGAMQTHQSSGGGGAKGHVMTSRSSTNLASKARQGSSTTKRTPLGGASSSSRVSKSSSSSIASKLGRDRR